MARRTKRRVSRKRAKSRRKSQSPIKVIIEQAPDVGQRLSSKVVRDKRRVGPKQINRRF